MYKRTRRMTILCVDAELARGNVIFTFFAIFVDMMKNRITSWTRLTVQFLKCPARDFCIWRVWWHCNQRRIQGFILGHKLQVCFPSPSLPFVQFPAHPFSPSFHSLPFLSFRSLALSLPSCLYFLLPPLPLASPGVLPNPVTGPGERCELPSGSGQSPADKAFLVYSELKITVPS